MPFIVCLLQVLLESIEVAKGNELLSASAPPGVSSSSDENQTSASKDFYPTKVIVMRCASKQVGPISGRDFLGLFGSFSHSLPCHIVTATFLLLVIATRTICTTCT
jgi:hypothetical protein